MINNSEIALQQEAFSLTPDPRFLFLTDAYRKAQAALIDTCDRRQGFTVLTAPPGMGKTTLLFDFLDTISHKTRAIFLFFTQCNSAELLRYIARDLGLDPSDDITQLHKDLVDVLIVEARAGRTVVLIIDEAQHLSDDAFEAIRLLTNFETARTKLLQVVLVGQPLLLQKLMSPRLVQVRQRVVSFNKLDALSKEDSIAYIQHRLNVAVGAAPEFFSLDALHYIASASSGVPRVINNVCCHILRRSASTGRSVDLSIVTEVVAELQLQSPIRHESRQSTMSQLDAPGTGCGRNSEMRSTAALLVGSVYVIYVLMTLHNLISRHSQTATSAQPRSARSTLEMNGFPLACSLTSAGGTKKTRERNAVSQPEKGRHLIFSTKRSTEQNDGYCRRDPASPTSFIA
jgi:type II secretory pathway predicted ATPase ExeA